jgi:VRR-NUC domain
MSSSPSGDALIGALDALERIGARLERLPESEAGFLGWVRDRAAWARPPWRTYHTLRSKGSEPGFPDLVLLRPPRLIFAELKVGRGRLSKPQRAWRDDLEAVGVEVYTWWPADRPAIERILR